MTSERRFEGAFLGIEERDRWEYVTRVNARGVVVIIPLTRAGELIFVQQFRVPVNREVIEFPAGLVGDHDDPDEAMIVAAERELLEETGYKSQRLRWLTRCPSSPGMSDELLDFFLAEDAVQVGPGGGEGRENITVHKVPYDQVDAWLATQQRAGHTYDPKIYSALYWLERRGQLAAMLPGTTD